MISFSDVLTWTVTDLKRFEYESSSGWINTFFLFSLILSSSGKFKQSLHPHSEPQNLSFLKQRQYNLMHFVLTQLQDMLGSGELLFLPICSLERCLLKLRRRLLGDLNSKFSDFIFIFDGRFVFVLESVFGMLL
jgi:hypothetical protein